VPHSPRPLVPRVYLSWAIPVYLAFFAFMRINNLHVFNAAFSSIPTAPTKLLSYQHVKRLILFQSEHLFQLNGLQCAPSNYAATVG